MSTQDREIVAVVDASGACAVQFPMTAPCKVTCSLVAWREGDGGMRVRELRIEKPESDEGARSQLMDALSAWSIVRLVVNGDGDRLQLVRVLETDVRDEQLEQERARRMRPVTFCDAQFGELSLDQRIDRYEGNATWLGRAVSLSADHDGAPDPTAALDVARALFADAENWQRKACALAVRELLATKNESWLDEGEQPVTERQFVERMSLRSVSVEPGGAFELWFDDGDLFWDHAIRVSGTLQQGLAEADIC